MGLLTEKELQLLGQQYEEADHSCGGVSLNEYLLAAQNAKTRARVREVVERAKLTSVAIRVLIDKAEEEYADVDMTDAEWEMKRWTIIARAMKQAILKALEEDKK